MPTSLPARADQLIEQRKREAAREHSAPAASLGTLSQDRDGTVAAKATMRAHRPILLEYPPHRWVRQDRGALRLSPLSEVLNGVLMMGDAKCFRTALGL